MLLEVLVKEFAPALVRPRGEFEPKVRRVPPKWVVSVEKRLQLTVQVNALSDIDGCAAGVRKLVNTLLLGNRRGDLYISEAMPGCDYAHCDSSEERTGSGHRTGSNGRAVP